MIGRSVCHIKKIVLSLLILSGLTVSLFSQDKQIGGKINVYRRVEQIGPGLNNVTLNSTDSIAPGDTVLMIQMQGIAIGTDQNAYGYAVQDTLGAPGGYEFLKVLTVDGGTRKVVFSRNLLNSFDIQGNVQLIRVPYYNSATVISKLTSKSWDKTEKTGGVLAMIVGGKLKFNAEIDVSGNGFRGGLDVTGIGECVNINTPLNNHDAYPLTFLNAGFKGEGLATHDELLTLLEPSRIKGQGINFTGGGGGNGKFTGGGGGANRGLGGDGGDEKYDVLEINGCAIPFNGAFGGTSVKSTPYTIDGIFFGGGGGAPTHASGPTQSSGGNGGGIVIIIADTISGKSNFIKADGAAALNAATDGGAGGGGAGGSIILSLQSFSDVPTDSLKISVKGGNGGISLRGFGNGGGGGGGLLWVSTPAVPAKVPVKVNYGVPGPGTLADGNGDIKYNFVPRLNGFLFNSIRSAVTGNQVDSICSDVTFGQITGTKPVGSTGSYSFLWEYSTTSDIAGFFPAPGMNTGQDYSPGLLTQTTWFRRVVTASGPPIITDISMPVKIIVQPAITGNLIQNDTIICYNQDPIGLTPSNAGPSNGNGHYVYKWLQNLTNTGWDTTQIAAGTVINAPGYDPSALKDTTYYKRYVTSGRCISFSPVVTITVLPLISGNITNRPDSVICEGSLFNILGATAPAGGDLSYKYQWQDSVTSSVWKPAVGSNTGNVYTPDTSSFSVIEKRYLRRIVFSGADSVCKSFSIPILLTRYHKIRNNLVSPLTQTIGYDSIPAQLTGLAPVDGAGVSSYKYLWQYKTLLHPWDSAIVAPFKSQNYIPLKLRDTTWYRRVVNSTVCNDTSNIVVVNVHKAITNNNISFISGSAEDTICSGSTPAILKGTPVAGGSKIAGDYSYKWYSSTTGGNPWNLIADSIRVDYQPGALVQTTYFRRDASSPAVTPTSVSKSNLIKITVLPRISNFNIDKDQAVCKGQPLPPLTSIGSGPAGGDLSYRYTWRQDSSNTGWKNIPGYIKTSSSSYSRSSINDPFRYRRYIYSGSNDCCADSSNYVSITINPLPTGSITPLTDTVCNGSPVPVSVHLTGSSRWNLVYKENSTSIQVNKIAASDTILRPVPSVTGSVLPFTYSLASLIDNNGCNATSLTGTRNVVVYKVPVANAGSDTAVCGPKVRLNARITVTGAAGTWVFPSAVVSPTTNTPSVTVTIDSLYPGGSIAYKFKWEEVNWRLCRSKDSVTITFDKRIYSINAGRDTSLFSFDNIIHMVADPVLTWEKGLWTVVSGTGDFTNNSNNLTEVKNLSKGKNTFLWTITNGTCKNEDLVNVSVQELIVPEGFSPNNDHENYNNTFTVTGLDLPNQIAELTVVNGAGTEVFSTSNRDGQIWTDWDGKNSKGLDLSEGTYYYLLKITSKGNGQVFKKSGFIVLKRY
jgi:hypothetical protein